MYESELVNKYSVNQIYYNNIFKVLKTIRLPNEEIDNLKNILYIE